MLASTGPTFLLLSLTLACGGAPPPGPVQGPAEARLETPSDPEPSPGDVCADIGEAACLESADCTLVLDETVEGGYRCRPAKPPCETGFRQGSDTEETCEAQGECRFQPGNCYCAPGVVCICGGGPPPTCTDAEAETPPVPGEPS